MRKTSDWENKYIGGIRKMAPGLLSATVCSFNDHRLGPRDGDRVFQMSEAGKEETKMANKVVTWDDSDINKFTDIISELATPWPRCSMGGNARA